MTQQLFITYVSASLLIILPFLTLQHAVSENKIAPKLSTDAGLLRIVTVRPEYPEAAKQKGIEGYVELSFDVSDTGTVENVKVIRAVPEKIFNTAAIAAMSRFKFKPNTIDGQPVSSQNVTHTMQFSLNDIANDNQPPPMNMVRVDELRYAHDAITEKNYKLAANLIAELKEQEAQMNANEVAQVHNLAGYLAFKQDNYSESIAQYKQVIQQPKAIPAGLYTTTLYTLAQLTFIEKDFHHSLNYMQQWQQQVDNPGHIPLIFMAQVNYNQKDYTSAITHMENGLNLAQQKDAEIKENWLKLLAYLYYEEQRWPEALTTLRTLNSTFPKSEYTKQIENLTQKMSGT